MQRSMRKGVILCGGRGTRLLPATETQNKHLLAIVNNPMVHYPITSLKQLGINDILIISGGDHLGGFAEFLKDGSRYGCELTYRVQINPNGIAGALALAEDFMRGESLFAVILGDNYFSEDLSQFSDAKAPSIFVKSVSDPERFGVYVKEKNTIIEKPAGEKGLAVTGLYLYDQEVFAIIKTLHVSGRGELEVTDINNEYLKKDNLDIRTIKSFWSDMGVPSSMVRTIRYVANKERIVPL